jgi:glycosyltransferase involved in cell wall biosynthesis
MTAEQVEAARATLSRRSQAMQLTVGIDTEFYGQPTKLFDIAKPDLARVERLLQSPYVIMPGDELRLNEDALAVVENSPLNLVRISQYGHKNALSRLKTEVARRNLDERLLIFESISYRALRFLLRHAAAYTGLVDATWQPSGWTVACESLASGLPVVLYEGLVARELASLGAGADIVRSVPMRDIKGFAAALESMITMNRKGDLAAKARAFAAQTLDLERTGAAFGNQLVQAISVE